MTRFTDRGNVRFTGVRDDHNVLHHARIARVYDSDGEVRQYRISTGCCTGVVIMDGSHGDGGPVPRRGQLAFKGFIVVAWNINEEPTCLACIVAIDRAAVFK